MSKRTKVICEHCGKATGNGVRTKLIQFRVTEEDYKKIVAQAELNGWTIGFTGSLILSKALR